MNDILVREITYSYAMSTYGALIDRQRTSKER